MVQGTTKDSELSGAPEEPGTRSGRGVRAALAVGLTLLVAIGVAGLFDVAQNGEALSALESGQTVLLWLAIGCAVAFLGGAAAWLLGGLATLLPNHFPGRRAPERVALGVLGLELLFLVFSLLERRWFGAYTAFVLSTLVLLFCWRWGFRASRRTWTRSTRGPALVSLALLLALGFVLGSGLFSAVPPSGRVALAGLALASIFAMHLRGFRGPERVVGGAAVLSLPALVSAAVVPFAGIPAVAGASEMAAREVGPGRPNVVLIVLDTQRTDYLGPYRDDSAPGYVPDTPELDRFAAQSTVFESCFATAPWTVPSHASLFTGLQPLQHGASFEHHRWLDDEFTTLAESLAEAGYRTAGFSANAYLRNANLQQGIQDFRWLGATFEQLHLRPFLQFLGFPEKWADNGAAHATECVESYLTETRDETRPQFLFVNLLEPHWRYLPPLKERREHLPQGHGLWSATRAATPLFGPFLLAGSHAGPEVQPVLRSMYAASVAYQDRRLGELLATIDEHLDPQNTLFVITADHGENLGEGGRFGHAFAINDHLLHVPLIVRQPGVFGAGARVSGLCSLLDLPTTIVELVDGAEMPQAEGRSLVPARFEPRTQVFAKSDPYYGHLAHMDGFTGLQRDVADFARPLFSVREERYKLVARSEPAPHALTHQLFDLEQDPDELRDVAAEKPQVTARLLAALEAWLASQRLYERAPGGGATATFGAAQREDTLELLDRTGYFGRRD